MASATSAARPRAAVDILEVKGIQSSANGEPEED
jgi:hypothetical protein